MCHIRIDLPHCAQCGLVLMVLIHALLSLFFVLWLHTSMARKALLYAQCLVKGMLVLPTPETQTPAEFGVFIGFIALKSLALINRRGLDLVDAELDDLRTSVPHVAADRFGEALLLSRRYRI